MQIIECPNVDLIEPYPLSEAKRVFGWMHSYSSITETDESPKTIEEYTQFLTEALPAFRSYGVIDKFNALHMDHPVPLIGIIAFQPDGTPWNGYLHVASTRRAWGGGREANDRRERTGLFDEACQYAFANLFETQPELLRLSAIILERNWAARNLAKRMGFVCEGKFEDMVRQRGEPRSLVHYGLTRRRWEENGILQEAGETLSADRG